MREVRRTATLDISGAACEALSADKQIEYLGHVDQVTSELIRNRVLKLLKKAHLLRDMSEYGIRLVDGVGIDHILNEVRAIS